MRLIDLCKMGLNNLFRRKLRTFLTIIGVVIGTFSIIVMVSIGIGMNESYTRQIMEMGSLTTITVDTHYYPAEGEKYDPSKPKVLNDDIIEQIKAMDHVTAVTPVMNKSLKLVKGKLVSWMYVTAIDLNSLQYFDFPELSIGEYITPDNPEGIILGYQSYWFYDPKRGYGEQGELDPERDKLSVTFDTSYGERQWGGTPNEEVKKKAELHKLKLFGVMNETQTDKDYSSYMDINVMKKYYKEYIKTLPVDQRRSREEELQSYNNLWVSVENIKHVEKVQTAIKELGFGASSLGDMLKPMQETSNMLQLVLGGIGAVSMLVSAIGIANTMVMSIYERTKEIGVMKVLGCLVSDVKKLFLFEASLIGLFGGIIGIGLSLITSYLINTYGGDTLGSILGGGGGFYYGGNQEMKFSSIPPWLAIAALLFSAGVGILSGYYPAKRATKISAIEAMKTES